jgi:NADH-quinone oxidoreductase subunit I
MIGILKGLQTTMRHMLRPAITEQYPWVKKTLPERSRTMISLPLDEGGVPLCKACMLCEKNCPDHAITMRTEKRADGPGRVLTYYEIDFGLCMYCGICVESCPSHGIELSGDYERCTHDKAETRVVYYDAPYIAPEPAEAPVQPAAPESQPATDAPTEAPAEGGDGQ